MHLSNNDENELSESLLLPNKQNPTTERIELNKVKSPILKRVVVGVTEALKISAAGAIFRYFFLPAPTIFVYS